MKKLIFFILSLVALCAMFSLSVMASEEIINSENEGEQVVQDEVDNDQSNGDIAEATNSDGIKEYLKEKILPVIVGVLTAMCALLATLSKIKKAMCDLGTSREEIKKEAQLRDLSFKEKSEYIQARIDEVNEALKDVPEVQVQLAALKKDAELLLQEMKAFCEILTLGFSANAEIIRSGKGKQMSQLLAKLDAIEAKEVVNNDEN